MSEKNTTPSPEALRAATAIFDEYEVGTSSRFCDDPPDWDSAEVEAVALIIERETGVKELRDTLQMARASIWWRLFTDAFDSGEENKASKTIANINADIQEIDRVLALHPPTK